MIKIKKNCLLISFLYICSIIKVFSKRKYIGKQTISLK